MATTTPSSPLKSLYSGFLIFFALIGIYSTFNWIWTSFVYMKRSNSDIEDFRVVSAQGDTIVNYKKIPPGKLHFDMLTGELTVESDTSKRIDNIPAHSTIEWTDYDSHGKRLNSTVFMFGEKKKRE